MSWFGEGRALAELKKQREALERIATVLEEMMMTQGRPTGTGLRSLYRAKPEVEGEVLMQSDEDLAELERLENERERAGGEVAIDEDLEGEW